MCKKVVFVVLKKVFIISLVLMFVCLVFPIKTSAVSAMSAQSAVLIDSDSLQVLYEKNKDQVLSMASTTKVMTALIACEYIEINGDLLVDITEEMVMVEGSSMGLRAGDNVNLSALVVGLILPSGNDAANSVAISIGGTLEGFALIMNEKAKELNMKNTNFVTPSGLDNEEHYTTAYDMALLLAHAMTNDYLAEVMGSQNKTVEFFSVQKDEVIPVEYSNHNKLLSLYDYTVGGKTGFTKKSGRCLVSAAQKDGVNLVAVTLNASDDWDDHIRMYDYGFAQIKQYNFEQERVQLATSEGILLEVEIYDYGINYVGEKDFRREIALPKFIYEKGLKYGETIGYVRYYVDNSLICVKKIIY